MAAAHISGTVALLLELDSELKPGTIKRILLEDSIVLDEYRSIDTCRLLNKISNFKFQMAMAARTDFLG